MADCPLYTPNHSVKYQCSIGKQHVPYVLHRLWTTESDVGFRSFSQKSEPRSVSGINPSGRQGRGRSGGELAISEEGEGARTGEAESWMGLRFDARVRGAFGS
jgi:hypothetical protein